MLLEMNKNFDPGHPPIEWREYLCWLDIWRLLATTYGHNHQSFWSTNNGKDPRFKGAPFRLNDLMSRTRFEKILQNTSHFNLPYHAFKDDFHSVWQLVKAWNGNMYQISTAAWIVCLDGSMSLWTNMWIYPGFVSCPQKPWNTGKEYHTLAYGVCCIIFHMEMVVGRGWAKDLSKMKFESLER
jgi:hypothetical protein